MVRGPEPTVSEARLLVRRWEFPTVEDLLSPPVPDPRWQISVKEFREDLQWAIVLPAETEPTDAVRQLLSELKHRGVSILYALPFSSLTTGLQ